MRRVQMIMLDVLTPIFFIRMEYAAQTKAAPSARISPAGFSSRTKAPFAMIRKMPVKAAEKPRKKRREKPSPFSRKWARRAVKKGTTATIMPTLEAKV